MVSTALLAVMPANPAHADPDCLNGGVHIVFARGASAKIGSLDEVEFTANVYGALGSAGITQRSWAEVGNFFSPVGPNQAPNDEYEYPATWAPWSVLMPPEYELSITKGVNELAAYLNWRYSPVSQSGKGCSTEVAVLGGYSQGAQVVRKSLSYLNSYASSRIAFVALYGDPEFDAGNPEDRAQGIKPYWIRGNAPGFSRGGDAYLDGHGFFGPADPYLPYDFRLKTGSWCDQYDGVCYGRTVLPGTHGDTYRQYWYWQSATEIARAAKFKLLGCNMVCPAQEVSVGPSGQVAMYTGMTWSFRVTNPTDIPVTMARVVVAIRGPSGNALDVSCAGGTNVYLGPFQEWTCSVTLPQGFGQAGTYWFWADWMASSLQWHPGKLGPVRTFTVTQAPTLSIVQPISIGPSDYRPKLTHIWFSYRVKNTSGGYASIQRFVVAVRGPAGDPLDVPCANGTGVTLAPGEEWTCDAQLPSGYGSTGTFIFWPDWMDYQSPGQWHQGMLGPNKTFRLY